MGKRRDFLKKSLIGTTGLVAGSCVGFSCKSTVSKTSADATLLKNWQKDIEWRKIRYGGWGGPGTPVYPGPMDSILVKDYAPRSSVVVPETFVPKAKYPVIDCHVHVLADTPEEVDEWVSTMDEVGMEKSIVLTTATGTEFDALVELLPNAHPDRFQVYCGLDTSDIDKSDYSDRAVAELVRCYHKGARGVGELSDKGYGLTGDTKLPANKRLHPDDPRLDAFWEKCAELKMPVSLHVADHPSCWTPLDVFQERTPDFQHFNQYGEDVPSYEELINIRNRTCERHTKTIFIACHLGNQGNDLGQLSVFMDKYPNLYLDTSARDYEMGRTPRAAAKFLTKYQNRIVFGTDQSREKSMYQMHWKLFETDDEYIVGRLWWRYYGMDLTAPVLESLYRNTAKKIFNI